MANGTKKQKTEKFVFCFKGGFDVNLVLFLGL